MFSFPCQYPLMFNCI